MKHEVLVTKQYTIFPSPTRRTHHAQRKNFRLEESKTAQKYTAPRVCDDQHLSKLK
jgi:hypothetical protein